MLYHSFHLRSLMISRQIVEMHSAILPGYESIGIRKDHRTMTKFRDRSASGYQSVSKLLMRWVEKLADKLTDDQKGKGMAPAHAILADSLSGC